MERMYPEEWYNEEGWLIHARIKAERKEKVNKIIFESWITRGYCEKDAKEMVEEFYKSMGFFDEKRVARSLDAIKNSEDRKFIADSFEAPDEYFLKMAMEATVEGYYDKCIDEKIKRNMCLNKELGLC